MTVRINGEVLRSDYDSEEELLKDLNYYKKHFEYFQDTIEKQQKRINKLEHDLGSVHGLYASDKEDMSYPFRLDFSKTLGVDVE